MLMVWGQGWADARAFSHPSKHQRRRSSLSKPWAFCRASTRCCGSEPAPCGTTTTSRLSTSAPSKVPQAGSVLQVNGGYKENTLKTLVLKAKSRHMQRAHSAHLSLPGKPLVSKGLLKSFPTRLKDLREVTFLEESIEWETRKTPQNQWVLSFDEDFYSLVRPEHSNTEQHLLVLDITRV